jgi:hypothetical protein
MEAIVCSHDNKRTVRQYLTYMGVIIWRNVDPNKLRWYTVEGGFAADTLDGIKQLIRESKNG